MATVSADDPERMTLAAVLTAWSRAIGTGYSQRRTVTELLAMIDEQEAGSERTYKHPELRAAILATAPRGRVDARGLGLTFAVYSQLVEAPAERSKSRWLRAPATSVTCSPCPPRRGLLLVRAKMPASAPLSSMSSHPFSGTRRTSSIKLRIAAEASVRSSGRFSSSCSRATLS
jgi:hypothetical protein